MILHRNVFLAGVYKLRKKKSIPAAVVLVFMSFSTARCVFCVWPCNQIIRKMRELSGCSPGTPNKRADVSAGTKQRTPFQKRKPSSLEGSKRSRLGVLAELETDSCEIEFEDARSRSPFVACVIDYLFCRVLRFFQQGLN
jgi:hypothetical protein